MDLINVDLINPELINSYFFSRPVNDYAKAKLECRDVSFYEMEFITESDGGMYIDGTFFQVKKGDVVFRRPGQTTQGVIPYSCFCIQFACKDYQLEGLAKEKIPPIIRGEGIEPIKSVIHEVFYEFFNADFLSPLFFRYQLTKLIFTLYSMYHPQSQTYLNFYSDKNEYVSKAIDFIQTNWQYTTIDEIAEEIGITKNYLMSLFKQETGKTINQYMAETKMVHAKKMLIFSKQSITDIALNCGFENTSYFTNFFKKKENISPSGFRNKYTV